MPIRVLGRPTLNVGWLRGGLNINSVPDEARFGLDVRLVPGVDPERLLERFEKATAGEVTFEGSRHLRPRFGPSQAIPGSPA